MTDDKKAPEAKEEVKSARQLEIEELRRVRTPAGAPTPNITFPKREGYERRVVCDRPGRLEELYKRGWRFVQEDTIEDPILSDLKISKRKGIDGRASQVVGSHKDGSPMVGYLMELPTELYTEDQAAKMEQLDALESGLRQGQDADGSGKAGQDGRYIPKHTGIKIDQKGRP